MESEPKWWSSAFEGVNLQGNNLREADLSYSFLQNADLRDARLEGVQAWDIRMAGAKLRRTHLEGADLFSAHLEGADLSAAHLERAYLERASLLGTHMLHAHLERSDLRGANLEKAYLAGTHLEEADLRGANLGQVNLLDVANLEHVRLYRAVLDRTQLTRDQLCGPVVEELERKWFRARETYLALKNNFEQIGRYDDASWAYRKERRMEKQEAWQKARQAFRGRDWGAFASKTWKVGWDLVVEYLCDYGESVGRVLGWMGFLLFIAGPLLFGLPGMLDWPEQNQVAFSHLPSLRRYAYAYLQQFLYVLDAFTTASFAELEPATTLTRILSGLTALIGVFLTGLLGFVAGNRIRRS